MEIIYKKPSFMTIINDTYLCVVGDVVSVFLRTDFSLVCCFSDVKNYSSALFLSESKILAKTTKGIYKIYDIEQKTCVKTIKIHNVFRDAQGTRFVLSENKKLILDVLGSKEHPKGGFFKIDIETSEYEAIGDGFNTAKNLSNDRDDVFFMTDMWLGVENNEKLSLCTVYKISCINMDYDIVYQIKKPVTDAALLFYNNKYILFENMDVIDISCNKVVKSINYKFSRTKNGYFKGAYISKCQNFLFFIYSEQIDMYNLLENKLENVYLDNYCSYAELVNDKVIISTWKKVYYINFPTE